ncbi:GH25 family lysozyme [Amaricoccus macauensis]|uniref:glycoside hydrolase family 25 protein n=1 Tax=Amaricoccus macauensis TaxID=57001 RepID=UPI003C79EE7B
MRILTLLLAAAILAGCGGGNSTASYEAASAQVTTRASVVAPRFNDSDPWEWGSVAPWHYPVHGIDVSKYQGDINWSQVRMSNASFAFIKATEGADHSDEKFFQNWMGSAAAQVPRGAYHYYYFCRTPEEQARWFTSHVPRDPRALPPVLDMEWTHKSRTCKTRPDPAHVRAQMQTWLDIVGRHYGRTPLIYTTVDFYADNELWRVKGHPFWLRSVADHPSNTYPGQHWTFWQYTGTGVVPGIEGDTDINVFAGTPDQWRLWAGHAM